MQKGEAVSPSSNIGLTDINVKALPVSQQTDPDTMSPLLHPPQIEQPIFFQINSGQSPQVANDKPFQDQYTTPTMMTNNTTSPGAFGINQNSYFLQGFVKTV